MNIESEIKKAIKEMELAETYHKLAAESYYRARKQLESVYSPAAPKRVKKGLDAEQLARIIAKRNNYIKRSMK